MARPDTCISGILFFAFVLPAALSAQTRGTWFVFAEAGRYEVHEGAPGFVDAPAGLLLAISGGRRWGPIGIHLALGQGLGDDAFTTFEPVVEVIFPQGSLIGLVAGAGAGVMWEITGSTLSLPYFGKLGIEGRFGDRMHFRLMLRRGAHANTGDSGTFRGPHAITLGVVLIR